MYILTSSFNRSAEVFLLPFLPLQFFDGDGDGLVSETDLSNHNIIPLACSLSHHRSSREKLNRQDTESGKQGDGDVSSESHHNAVATVQEKMNLGQYSISILSLVV